MSDSILEDSLRRFYSDSVAPNESEPLRYLRGVDQRYTEFNLIGEGGLKYVYECYDRNTRRTVAYASLKTELGDAYQDIFVHEAWLTSALKHPNIIKVHDVGISDEEKPFFTMDLKSGKSFADFVQQQPDLNKRLDVFETICSAVSYAHSQGVLHLDIKPDNIQCDEFDEVLVCDWGLGKKMGESEYEAESAHLHEAAQQTLYGERRGTPGYMAPEQITKGAIKDARTDIYALGCLFCFLLTGSPPHRGERASVMERTVTGDLAEFLTLMKGGGKAIAKPLQQIATKAIQTAPAQRYESVSAMLEDVRRFRSGYSLEGSEFNLMREAWLFTRRHLKVMKVVTVSVVCMVIASVLWTSALIEKESNLQSELQNSSTLEKELLQQNDLEHMLISSLSGGELHLSSQLSKKAHDLMWQEFSKGPSKELVEKVDSLILLLKKAQELDESYYTPTILLRRLYFIKLDFKAAKALPYQEEISSDTRLVQYLEHLPDVSYGESLRPSTREFAGFINQISCMSFRDKQLLQSSIIYDASCAPRADGTPILVEYIHYVNEYNPQLEITYEPSIKRLTVSANDGLYLKAPLGGDNGLMAYLSLDSLALNTVNKRVDMSDLNGLTVRELDVSKASQLSFDDPHQIRGLESLILPISEQERFDTEVIDSLGLSGVQLSFQ